jgi:hypothetical protein
MTREPVEPLEPLPSPELVELEKDEQQSTDGGRCWRCYIGLPHAPFADGGGCEDEML